MNAVPDSSPGMPLPQGMADAYPPTGYAWSVVWIVCIITIFALIDRQLLYLLVDPMRRSLGISDTQISLIQGLAFVLFYSTMSIPIGALVDRTNRRNVIIVGILLWSAMTILCGLATDFWTLFAARAGVGVGEAVLAPATYSLLADYFPPARRGRAIAAVGICGGLGAGASFLLGSAVLHAVPGDAIVHLPVIGAVLGWQLTFFVAGAPGLVLAALAFVVREVPRKERSALAPLTGGAMSRQHVRDMARALVRANGTVLLAVFGASGLIAMVGYAHAGWMASFFIRVYDVPPASVGLMVGLLSIVGALGGGALAGPLSDRLAQARTGGRIDLYLYAIGGTTPFLLLWPIMPDMWLSFAVLMINMVFINAGVATSPAVIQEIIPNELRGLSLGVFTLVQGILGAGLGPVGVALATDYVFASDKAVGLSVMLLSVPALLCSALLVLLARRGYQRARGAFQG